MSRADQDFADMTASDFLLLLFWALCLAVSLAIGVATSPGGFRFRRRRRRTQSPASDASTSGTPPGG
jgi:hypothetical protein